MWCDMCVVWCDLWCDMWCGHLKLWNDYAFLKHSWSRKSLPSENMSHNELVYKLTESKWRSRAAARRTLMTWRQPTAHCHLTTLPTLMNSLKRHSRSRFSYPSLRRCCPSQVAILSVRRVSPCQVFRIQLKPLLMPWSSGVWHPLASLLIGIDVEKNSSWGAILLRPSAKRIPQNFKCLFIVWLSKCFVPRSAQLSFPPTRVILMSTLITRRCNHSVGVAVCLMRPAPLRIAMARPAVASNLMSRLGLSIPSSNPFALTSTPCCCKTTPRSRIIETQPIPAAAALTAAWKSASELERLTTASVVDVDFRRCFQQNILQELVLLLLCKHLAKFELLKHVVCLGTISCLPRLWMHRGYFNGCISSVLPHRPLSVPPSLFLTLYWQITFQFDQLTSTRVSWH